MPNAKFATYRCGLLRRKAPAHVRFTRDIDKNGPEFEDLGRCWIWRPGPSSGAYGRICVRGVKVRVHRYSWVLHRNKIPDGLQVLHRCDRPLCVNPDHLFLGTQKDNQEDMVAKGRVNKGEDRPQALMTEEWVLWIRKVYKRGHPVYGRNPLARRFKVSPTTIKHIIQGVVWRYLL